MASPQMVDRILNLPRNLQNSMGLLPKDDLYTSVTQRGDADNFLFELKVLFSLLDYLTTHGWRCTIANKQMSVIRLPRSPGLKKNFSYFVVEHTKTGQIWQIVHGTQIEDQFGEPRAPDISLQTENASIQPTYRDIKAIWDAKLRGTDDDLLDNVISDSEYRSFVWVKDKLRIPWPNSTEDVLAGWPPAFEVCALITNGKSPTENVKVFLSDHASITAQFKDASTPTFPRRMDYHKPPVIKKLSRNVRGRLTNQPGV
ncbi:hypothetical protein [Paenibacillus koleovorans]|uniref:hypothetical protein n=1 Tax=Paenibacillus koleovorans TaxID=121608 RepID=UPI000FDC12C3|nr:hypothetical protein [Paenibacillus koleovorans]